MGWESSEDDRKGRREMMIPFVNLSAQYLSIKGEIDNAIQAVVDNSAFSSGPFVKSFEENFAVAQDSKYCVGVNSGTSALHVALWALNIGAGDEVIVPANTFFATPQAVSLTGATPVFTDVEPDYYNIDPVGIEKAITGRTKAVIAVNLYGQPARLDKIRGICDEKGLYLIEDCAQSHLAEYRVKKTGTFGVCGCFSFYPGKNLGAFGEAGAVVTDDETLALKMAALREHGSSKKYFHDYIGHNYRMDGIQGAVLDVKLRYLAGWTERRRENASLYRRYLAGVEEVTLPKEMPDVKHVYHLFVVRIPKRDGLLEYLRDKGIATGIHYPVPCHLQKAYAFMGNSLGSLPVSEKYADEILSLPMYAELTRENIELISNYIKEFYKR